MLLQPPQQSAACKQWPLLATKGCSIWHAVEDKLAEREQAANAELDAAAASRQLTVTFNADVSDGMPWKFRPSQRSVTLRPGESTLAFYVAENLSNKSIIGVSTYNVTPQQAGYYFNKIQCFCFEEQKLRPGEQWLAALGPLPGCLACSQRLHVLMQASRLTCLSSST